jgi:hypothetical protein
MTKGRLLAIFSPALLLLILIVVSDQVRISSLPPWLPPMCAKIGLPATSCSASTIIELNTTSDSITMGLGQIESKIATTNDEIAPESYRLGGLTAFVSEVQVLSASTIEINGSSVAGDGPIFLGPGPASHPATLRMTFEASPKYGASVLMQRMPDRRNWFEIKTNPMAISTGVFSEEPYPIKRAGNPYPNTTGPTTFRCKSQNLRFKLAEDDLVSRSPFEVSQLSYDFADLDKPDRSARLSTLRRGSIVFEEMGGKKREINEGEPLEIRALHDGRIDFIRLSGDGIQIVGSGRATDLSLDRKDFGVIEDLMPTVFERFANPEKLAAATLGVAFATLIATALTLGNRKNA